MNYDFTENEVQAIFNELGWTKDHPNATGVKRTIAAALQYARNYDCEKAVKNYNIEGYAHAIAERINRGG